MLGCSTDNKLVSALMMQVMMTVVVDRAAVCGGRGGDQHKCTPGPFPLALRMDERNE